MADEKTFRYAFIMLGFFLVMTGLFIMSVDKPHIYITFCTLGILLVAVGITWSMCQCYPKITFVPADSETEQFLVPRAVLPAAGEKPGKQRLQAPDGRREEPGAYEKSLPTYEQAQRQAAAEVHPERPGPAAAPHTSLPRGGTAAGGSPAAPLATFPEELDGPSPAGSAPGSPGTARDDLYYGLHEGWDTLAADGELQFEPED
ncbi:barttin [Nothoprocta perdicaria]|uniref:barttin n=1 Tax=Nothoprocta perdicaria TaxID=30464 RepID=UPI000E1BB1A0|nr:barttin [Nothoprocta perdicaria]